MKFDPREEFTFLHQFATEDILNWLKNSDLFVFASSCENMPNTLLEAMSTGLPIACSFRGPMIEVLKDGGLYFNPEEPSSIEFAISELIKTKRLEIDANIEPRIFQVFIHGKNAQNKH